LADAYDNACQWFFPIGPGWKFALAYLWFMDHFPDADVLVSITVLISCQKVFSKTALWAITKCFF
jgi:hypothetical protein